MQRKISVGIILICIFLTSCEDRLKPQTCHYCNGGIHYHIKNKNFLNTEYTQQYKIIDNKTYHTWCAKFYEEEGKDEKKN